MSDVHTFDPIWEEKYRQGHAERYPWDMAVSFVYRYHPRCKPREEVRILEIGCGTGNNLWFAAREGFQVTGIDGSISAIALAQNRFSEEGLNGRFLVGDFTNLPFENQYFDLAIDRGALTCCGFSGAKRAVEEVKRVLQKGGFFLCNPYSDRHSSHTSGQLGPDQLTLNISIGTLIGVGQICFYNRKAMESLFTSNWKFLSLQHIEMVEQLNPQHTIHAEWRVIVQKETI